VEKATDGGEEDSGGSSSEDENGDEESESDDDWEKLRKLKRNAFGTVYGKSGSD